MARSITTTDHDTIRKWAEERGGKPSEVASAATGDDVGIIRIDFPGLGGEGKLQEISWENWFKKFDEAGLALVCEEATADGQRSNFNELVGREMADARAKSEKTTRRAMRPGRSSASSKPGARAASPRGSRQAARPVAARTAGAKRSSRSAGASRGGAKGKKATAARKRTTARTAGTSSSRKGGRARGARKGK